MTDLVKRRTLKGFAAAAAGTATAGLASTAVAKGLNHDQVLASDGHIAIHTRISPRGNDVEAVFTNAGTTTLHVDDITPHNVDTFRGQFNVSKLTADAPLVLEPGASVSVHMTPHGDRAKFNDLMRQGQSLTQALKASATATNTRGVPIHISVNETLPFA